MAELQLTKVMDNYSDSQSRLMDYLPAIYRQSEKLAGFLSAFESMLFDAEAGKVADKEAPESHNTLQQHIDEIPLLFDPEESPSEFLPWLAQWVVLTIHEGIPESQRRQLIAKMIPLYRIRGTRAYLRKVLQLYTAAKPVVQEEDLPGMQVGIRSTVGHDARLGEDPFRFRVHMTFSSVPESRERRLQLLELTHTIVGLSKPAHTHYRLTHNLVEEGLGLVIYVRSTVGIDTLLWGERSE